MHEFGNHLGTMTFYAELYEVDEEYEEFLDTLSRDELLEELMIIKAQMDALNNLKLDH